MADSDYPILLFPKPVYADRAKRSALPGNWVVQKPANKANDWHLIFEGNSEASIQEGDEMIIKVNCRKDAGDIREPIRFGLAVTLEVAEEIPLYPISIYEEVRELLSVRVRNTVDVARV